MARRSDRQVDCREGAAGDPSCGAVGIENDRGDLRVGLDASNLRGGGGITHLVEMLRAAEPERQGVTSVIVWAGRSTLERLPDRQWLERRHDDLLDRNLLWRTYWQRSRLPRLAREADCNVVLAPGGTHSGDFRPTVTMSRNMLPFEWRELLRYGLSPMTVRLALLRWEQSRSFRRADGLIFLTRYAHDAVIRISGRDRSAGHVAIIPHGVHDRFAGTVREQLPISQYSVDRPFRIVYVSIVDVYKHQPEVVEAIGSLRQAGLPVALDLIGPAYGPALRRLHRTLQRVDGGRSFICYLGPVANEALYTHYARANLCVFASSCENMPNILLEGMASGLPIACSKLGPMPEILGDAGRYFDPKDPADIARAVRELITSPTDREALAQASKARSGAYTWEGCAAATFAFLAMVARRESSPLHTGAASPRRSPR